MSRVKLSEYTAKKLLEPDYTGIRFQLHENIEDRLDPNTHYVVKIDHGVKKRGKQGLIELNVAASGVMDAAQHLADKGYTWFLVEPMIAHEQEHYVSFERVREGISVSYSPQGGIDVEEHADQIQHFVITDHIPDELPLPHNFIQHLIDVMNQQHMAFVEINPLVFVDDQPWLLDAAVLVDSAAPRGVGWSENDLATSTALTAEETAIKELAESSTAAFSFSILNAEAPIWLLLSGGGASITIADEANNQGQADKIGNYGEYSGGPTTEETYLYTCEVIKALLKSKAPKKALVIAGGVANFTDIRSTFKGIAQAFEENKDDLKAQGVKVFVRRGGPNEREGLAQLTDYLQRSDLFGSVHGSDTLLTTPVIEALEYVNA